MKNFEHDAVIPLTCVIINSLAILVCVCNQLTFATIGMWNIIEKY